MSNKHGFPGVRKRTDYPFRRKPYYARMTWGAGCFIYSRNFATVHEAALAYRLMVEERERCKTGMRSGSARNAPSTPNILRATPDS